MKNWIKNNFYYIVIILMLLCLCFIFPYTGDDWAWGTSIGIDRLTALFYNYNGRWAGNLLILLITRYHIIRTVLECAIFTGIIILINKISIKKAKNEKNNFLLILFLFLLMPISIFRQTITWASGFANYVPPILLYLIIIYKNNSLFYNKENSKEKFWMIIIYLIMGLINALFMENITIYIVCLGIIFTIYELTKYKKVSIHNIGYTFGSILGSIIMFSNEAYKSIFNGADSYRNVEQGNIIINSIKKYIIDLDKYIFINNVIIGVLISALLIYILVKHLKNKKIKKIDKIFSNIFLISTIFYATFIIYINLPLNTENFFMTELYVNLLNGFISGMFFLSIAYTGLFIINDIPRKKKIIFYLLSLIISNGPLLVISPIGPRLFLSNYIFFILILLELYNYLNLQLCDNNIMKIFVIILFIFYIIIYAQIFYVQNKTTKYINNVSSEENILKLPALPYTNYIHGANPTDNVFQYRYKLYYNIDEKKIINWITYNTWKDNYDNK